MFSVRMESLGKAGPLGVEASPFHDLMANRMAREGVLRRLPAGGYLVAVREADLPAIVGLRSAASGRIDLRACDGVHLAEIEVFADVLDAEMRCTLLSFPPDFAPEAAVASQDHAAAAEAPRPPAHADGSIDSLMDALGRALSDDLAVAGASRGAVRDPLLAQIARDLPEIERILRGAGAPA